MSISIYILQLLILSSFPSFSSSIESETCDAP